MAAWFGFGSSSAAASAPAFASASTSASASASASAAGCSTRPVASVRKISCGVRGSGKYVGIAAYEDKLFCAPSSADEVLVIDTGQAGPRAARTIAWSSVRGEAKWAGICMARGKLFCAPYNAPDVLIIDGKTEMCRSVPCGVEGGGKFDGIAAALGGRKLFCAPSSAPCVLVIDADTESVRRIDCTASLGALGMGVYKWAGICAAAGGRELYCAPCHASCVLVIDATTETIRTIPLPRVPAQPSHPAARLDPQGGTAWNAAAAAVGAAARAQFKYRGICAAAGGRRLYCAPSAAPGVLMIDAMTETTRYIPCSIGGAFKWSGLAQGGQGGDASRYLFCSPCQASCVLVIDTKMNDTHVVASGLQGKAQWEGVCVGRDGLLYCAPCHAPEVLRLEYCAHTDARAPETSAALTPGPAAVAQSSSSTARVSARRPLPLPGAPGQKLVRAQTAGGTVAARERALQQKCHQLQQQLKLMDEQHASELDMQQATYEAAIRAKQLALDRAFEAGELEQQGRNALDETRQGLERGTWALEEGRALLEQEKKLLQEERKTEREALEKEREALEKDREALAKEREALAKEIEAFMHEKREITAAFMKSKERSPDTDT